MTFQQFALNNIIRSKRTYVGHFLSSTFSVMVFFIYSLLVFHPDLQGELTTVSVTLSALGEIGMQTSQYIIFIFSFFCLVYSVSVFLKTRKKEFGFLMLQGMSPRQLHQLVFIENMIIGITAIVCGIVMGLILAKLILIICSNVLGIHKGLTFYVPIKAILMTIIAFSLLFLAISLLTLRIVKVGQIIELLRSEEKPKSEPKASIFLSLLAIILIIGGYELEFYFTMHQNLFFLIPTGVVLVVIGTYFIFTQFSVYILHILKRKESIFLKKLNLLTISELIYRMRDNAIMFFLVAIISAVSFTGIGIFMSLGNPGLSAMTNPFAFTYQSSSENKAEKTHVLQINKKLEEFHFSYREAAAIPKKTENNLIVFRLTDFNSIAYALGQPRESLKSDDETIIVPTTVSQLTNFKRKENVGTTIDLLQGDMDIQFRVKKTVPYIGWNGQEIGEIMVVVSDSMYEKIPSLSQGEMKLWKYHVFVVKDWEKSKEVASELKHFIPMDEKGDYSLDSLVIQWLSDKQENGMLLIISALVGIVFFTFAASFLYARLYTDLERDQQQYMTISKVGLTQTELKKVITRQLCIMFFLPLAIAVVHSIVAFVALQQLVSFSIVKDSFMILTSFIVLQFMYFFVIRSRYLRYLYKKIM
ncbi:FtsX-like permease family protein [Bacillus cereus]|uniref:FtsX-like permease family protein n=1 Tax=Bacillus cereus TaxID=1396 RepID=A0AB73UC25_BACCE|nr:FtsX-like permease family protein [Bacillus cereus]QHV03714.1 ABC transporter permease [Bacillus cereus]QHV41724.1 FtsX-like permease family protein [Bacillus cereus]